MTGSDCLHLFGRSNEEERANARCCTFCMTPRLSSPDSCVVECWLWEVSSSRAPHRHGPVLHVLHPVLCELLAFDLLAFDLLAIIIVPGGGDDPLSFASSGFCSVVVNAGQCVRVGLHVIAQRCIDYGTTRLVLSFQRNGPGEA